VGLPDFKFCITLTAVLFAGALSLYFSISSRFAYAVILKTIFVLGIIYFFIPFIIISFLFWIEYRSITIAIPVSIDFFCRLHGISIPF